MPATPLLNLAVVMTSFDAGGTERQMIELVRRLDRSRWNLHVACLHARGAWLSRVTDVGPIAEFPITGFRRPDTCRQALAFARWCTRHQIDVVHAADFYTNVFALPAAAFARVPLRIGSRRGVYRDLSLAQLALQRAACACAHAIVANSAAIAAQLQAERIPPDKVVIVPNGLDLAAYRPAPASTRRRRVIMVSNLRPEKGHAVLVDAAVEILQRFPDAHFDVVGAGPELLSIQARLIERGIARAFSLLGQREDVPALLARADIAVLPSHAESLPNAVLEAMAAGLPVVASAVGGVPELIADGRTGCLVPAGDAEALAHRICVLMDDPALGTRLGLAARAEVQARYSFPRMVSAMEALYVHELAKRGRRGPEMAA